jgi:hypothetical protein
VGEKTFGLDLRQLHALVRLTLLDQLFKHSNIWTVKERD